MTNWVHPLGTLSRDGWEVVVDGALEGWQYTGLKVATLGDGDAVEFADAGVESIILPLEGSFTVEWSQGGDSGTQVLEGRASIIRERTDCLYLGSGASARITGTGRVAVAQARADEVVAPVYLAAADVPVFVRGAGRLSREVRNFGMAGVIPAAKLLACEVVTPGGNWSSYPAHKHDTDVDGQETNLEEIYYFETRSALESTDGGPSYGLFSTRGADRELEIDARVQSGDVVLVPHGFHGPLAVPPGVFLYQLNVMAGPGVRQWLAVNETGADEINELVAAEGADARLPVTR